MITAHHKARKSSEPAPIGALAPLDVRPPASTAPVRPRIGIISDVICSLVVLALGVSAGFPLLWGLALHQTPMAVSAGCAQLLCAVVLLNRCFAPAVTRTHAVPFLTALEERPWILGVCLVLALISLVTLFAYWPSRSG